MIHTLKRQVVAQLPNLAVLGWLLVAGCANPKFPGMVLDAVGPAPGGSEVGQTGMLVVYSTYNLRTNVDRFYRFTTYSDYKVLTKSGALLQVVRNDADEMEGPGMIELPAADYRVRAFASGYGILEVPVAIKANQVTVVHLDDCTSWPNREEMIRAGAVRLPDGRVVGWPATPQSITNP